MTKCNVTNYNFQPVKGRRIEASFNGGDVSSDGGSLLLREADRSLDLTKRIANILQENRQKAKIQHSNKQIVRQRLYALALGYEDLNDHDELRKDPLFQTAVEQDQMLASASTLCRFENTADRDRVLDMSELLVNLFIESFDKPPEELVLDFDATDHFPG